MKNKVLLAVLLLAVINASSQKTLPEFGQVDSADLIMKSCSFYPDANAMILFDTRETEYDAKSFVSKLRSEKRVRIKIFNEKGFKYANVKIPYYSKKNETRIKDLKGVVYNLSPDGKIVQRLLESSDFIKGKMQDKVGVINFTFPDLKPGSIIEYSYSQVDKDVNYIEPWIIQNEIPCAYSSIVITSPIYSRLKEKVYGEDTIGKKVEMIGKSKNQKYQRSYYQENIPPFKYEPFMSSAVDNKERVVFIFVAEPQGFFIDMAMSRGMWSFLGMDMLRAKNFGGQIKIQIPGTEKIIDSAKLLKTTAEKIGYIYDEVRKRIPDKPEQTLYPDDIKEAWENKTANSSEANLILLNLLSKADITAYPVLISTRSHGKINADFPSIGQVNGFDVLVLDSIQTYLMDVSVPYQSFQTPPFNVLNRDGFLISNDNMMQWVHIADSRPLLKHTEVTIADFHDNGTIEGTSSLGYYDYAKSFALDTTSDKDEGSENKFFDENPSGFKILSSKKENENNDNEPLLQEITFTYEPQHTGDFYFINPKIISSDSKSPFVSDTRNTDIDFGCNQLLSLSFQLTLPGDFQIESLPKNVTVRAPDTSFIFARSVSVDSSTIYYSQKFEIKRSLFDKEEYPAVKEFFSRVFGLMTEEIVIKKKK
ncbi:MAG: DUF3857 domain-containing protein [Bacteroidetes bacterium]|nr:DUF3857 domain-containing protein [Bacteroidota bacterium]